MTEWLRFDGTAERGEKTTILHPVEDPNILLEFDNDDVVDGTPPFIKKGCHALRIEGVPQCGCKKEVRYVWVVELDDGDQKRICQIWDDETKAREQYELLLEDKYSDPVLTRWTLNHEVWFDGAKQILPQIEPKGSSGPFTGSPS